MIKTNNMDEKGNGEWWKEAGGGRYEGEMKENE